MSGFYQSTFRILLTISITGVSILNAATDRIRGPVDGNRVRVVRGNLHGQAQPQFDRGAVDPAMKMNDMVMIYKPSTAQQSDLDTLLTDQQNPGSPHFHQWLTPEQYGDRFGLSAGDHSKVVAWLTSQGFKINDTGRGRNWVSFSGTAGQVTKSLHTAVHRYQVEGQSHFANVAEPSVPEALADITGGFLGLHDFLPQSFAHQVQPEFTSGTSHYLSPDDFSTIYNVGPLYKAGIDGTNQNIVVVGQSAVLLSDLRAFRTLFGLPANDPKMLLYSTDPGFTGSQVEGNLDLEWAAAVAPKATITYVYGPSAFGAMIAAISANLAPVITVSYGFCEVGYAPSFYRSIAQQANAQGITILNSSGDSGAAGCDAQGGAAFASHGKSVDFPAVMPEVTGVGGTQFLDTKGTYWATSNTPNQASALSYIPEGVWNENGPGGLLAGGGGASVFYPKPAWQTGPGVPNDDVRHVPDVSLSGSIHDGYLVYYNGSLVSVGGTSASAPSFAGIIALLNQYQVSKGFQKQAGLGNINPQLYRLAQVAPSAFHDVTTGDNIAPCAQGSPDCLTGSFGYPAGQGYDMGVGLGSVDANAFVTSWNTASQPVTVVLSLSATRVTPSDTVGLTAGVYPVGPGTPTGTVSFSVGTIPLGTAPLVLRNGQMVADVFFPAYKLQGIGTTTISAQYSGDATFSAGGAQRTLQIVVTAGAAAIIPSWPNTVWPSNPDAQGLSWSTSFSLREAAGVAAMITNFAIDGVAQPISTCFPTANIQAGAGVTCNLVFRNLAPPVTRTFGFAGIDAAGQSWSREFSVNYNPPSPREDFNLTATPLVVTQNTSADPSCQWAVQLNVDDFGGSPHSVSSLQVGNTSMSSSIPSIFGTERLDAFGALTGKLCFRDITPPATDLILVGISSGVAKEVAVSFAAPPVTATKISASPVSVSLAGDATHTATATISVGITDKNAQWTAAITPANRVTSWLTLSQYSGTGPGQIVLTANGTGFGPGAYRATITIQSASAQPQYLSVPVMYVLGGSTAGTKITAIGNAANGQNIASPGTLLAVYGTKLANATTTPTGSPIPLSVGGVSATVNGSAAPIVYASPDQLNVLVPYEVGAGPAVLSINNNGEVAGFQFQIAPSAPAIFVDANGDLTPSASAKPGAAVTLLITGSGEMTPAIKSAYTPTTTASAAGYHPVLPVSVTIGGVQAFVQAANMAANQFGVFQVTFLVPPSTPVGRQPVVVTVGAASSAAANLTVQAVTTASNSITMANQE